MNGKMKKIPGPFNPTKRPSRKTTAFSHWDAILRELEAAHPTRNVRIQKTTPQNCEKRNIPKPIAPPMKSMRKNKRPETALKCGVGYCDDVVGIVGVGIPK